jgi:hypothetical protein
MRNAECPETHTDTYIVSKDELERMKTNGWISNEVVGLLGCNKCEDFYELVKIPSVVTTILLNK